MKKLCFLAGLPRSGSTVLASILNQRKDVYVSPTSELVGLLFYTNQIFTHDNTIANPVFGRKNAVLNGIVDNFYQNVQKPVIIDKNRAWPNPDNIKMLEEMGKEVKIICTLRSTKDIVASFIRLIARNPQGSSFIDKDLMEKGVTPTLESRCQQMISEQGHVYQAWQQIQWNLQSEYKDRMLLVEYDNLIEEPASTLLKIEKFLSLEPGEYDINNINNKERENDSVYGLNGMHKVRPKLEKTSGTAEKILGEEICKFLSQFDIKGNVNDHMGKQEKYN